MNVTVETITEFDVDDVELVTTACCEMRVREDSVRHVCRDHDWYCLHPCPREVTERMTTGE